jgi:hypothetical protein
MAPIADLPKKAEVGEDGLTKHQRYYQWYCAVHPCSLVYGISNNDYIATLRLKKRIVSVGVNDAHNYCQYTTYTMTSPVLMKVLQKAAKAHNDDYKLRNLAPSPSY